MIDNNNTNHNNQYHDLNIPSTHNNVGGDASKNSIDKMKRIILKLSGEFLAGYTGFCFDFDLLDQLTDDILEIKDLGYNIGIFLGGGNIARGRDLSHIDRTAADNVGMLATIQNAIVVAEVIQQKNYQTQIFSSFPVDKICRYYTYQDANISMTKGNICFFCGGTGNPFFTTDTAAILRAVELKCDMVLKGTMGDGIYTADPKKDKNAQFIKTISYADVISKKLNIMDMTAFSLAQENKIPIKIFNITKKGNIKNVLLSNNTGTYVSD